ncbi:MAG: riboflavin synthase [Gammaproteobacteria bacterium]|nr:riboflavin synthase [Gammaproteobacteria bacterium]
MFSGIVNAIGTVARVDAIDMGCCLRVSTGALRLDAVQIGDSISVNGVCLTVIALHADAFDADVSVESLDRTTLGELHSGDPANLELALTLAQPLGGHLVTGHIDGVAEIVSTAQQGTSRRLKLMAPAELGRYIASKGSVAIDGVSLTVNAVDGSGFEVMIVPHTLESTIISDYRDGTRVNIEVDMIARYLERILQYTDASTNSEGAK